LLGDIHVNRGAGEDRRDGEREKTDRHVPSPP
jgi:hypothetical protein